ncbi:MAG TPA: hypothetical protein VF167_17185 [Longimicrobiaceae bacterium]
MRKLLRFSVVVAFAAVSGCGETPATPLEPGPASEDLIGGVLRLVGETLPVLNTVSSATIGPEGGTLNIAGGHSLYFPAGALAQPTTIVAVRDPLQLVVNFSPEGLVFPDSARPVLSFDYSTAGLLTQLNALNLNVVYLDGFQLLDVLPTTVDTQEKVVQAQLEHFSTYALATD